MRIGRIRRLHLPLHFTSPVMWLGTGALATGLILSPALAQGPPGAAAAAAGAAAAATASAPAPPPRKSAASAAADAAAMGNSALTRTDSSVSGTTEEAANGAAPAIAPEVIAKIAAGPLPKDVALQCSNLLKLATNLKSDVAKTSKDVLSISVIRDAGQIEEMAKKMREAQH